MCRDSQALFSNSDGLPSLVLLGINAVFNQDASILRHAGRHKVTAVRRHVDRLYITYGGKAQELPNIDPITRAVLLGFLSRTPVNDLNNVNVRSVASTLGLTIEEKRSSEPVTFNEWLHVQAFRDGEKVISAGGTFFGSPDNPRIVRLFSQPTEIVPSGVVLLLENKDRPGIVGYLGTLLGRHKVNIASMSLTRDTVGGHDVGGEERGVCEREADPERRSAQVHVGHGVDAGGRQPEGGRVPRRPHPRRRQRDDREELDRGHRAEREVVDGGVEAGVHRRQHASHEREQPARVAVEPADRAPRAPPGREDDRGAHDPKPRHAQRVDPREQKDGEGGAEIVEDCAPHEVAGRRDLSHGRIVAADLPDRKR
jgi:hypothetical protein